MSCISGSNNFSETDLFYKATTNNRSPIYPNQRVFWKILRWSFDGRLYSVKWWIVGSFFPPFLASGLDCSFIIRESYEHLRIVNRQQSSYFLSFHWKTSKKSNPGGLPHRKLWQHYTNWYWDKIQDRKTTVKPMSNHDSFILTSRCNQWKPSH